TQAAIAVALVWSGSTRDLLDYTSVGLAALSGLTVASVIRIRHRPDLPHPYRVPLYPLPPLVFLALTFWTVAHFVTHEKFERRLPAQPSLLAILPGGPLFRLLSDRPPSGNRTV